MIYFVKFDLVEISKVVMVRNEFQPSHETSLASRISGNLIRPMKVVKVKLRPGVEILINLTNLLCHWLHLLSIIAVFPCFPLSRSKRSKRPH